MAHREAGAQVLAGRDGRGEGTRLLRDAAFLTIVVAGLKLAGEVIVPVIVAAFVTIICVPAVHALRRRRVPRGLAVALVLIAVLGLILLASFALVNSARSFGDHRAEYQSLIEEKIAAAEAWLGDRGVEIAKPDEKKPWDPARIATIAARMATAAADTFSSVFLVLLIVIFMLLEASGLPQKIRRAMGDPHADLGGFQEIGKQVWRYLSVKTVISLMVGLCFGVFLAILGIEYAVLWGLLAFLLNYIPNIGSLLAAIPPIVLTLLTRDMGTAVAVAAGNVVINQVAGNIIEPRMMGARLGLSPLVVLLSLVFWGWLWGGAGMLLSVPLTMVVKIFLENHEDLRWVAVLLGPSKDSTNDPVTA